MTLGVTPVGAQAEPPAERQRVIVQLDDAGAVDAVAAEEARAGAAIRHRYRRVLDGFAADIPVARLEGLRRNPLVRSVTPDADAHAGDVQTGPTWGLDRTDQRPVRGDGRYGYSTTGAGVTAYVIDSGIRTTHAELRGRASSAVDYIDGTHHDCNGHGTHVAGTIGGTTYGIAKQVDLVSLRVLGCNGSGPWSGVIAAMDWVVLNRTGPAVMNMSLGGARYALVDEAVARATEAGVVVAVRAMNDNRDACEVSPAAAPSAVTVGAADVNDQRASFSNFGSCVDLFGPGVSVLSSASSGDDATTSMSGTSMAAPHVAGVVARHLQSTPGATPAQLGATLVREATQGVITNARSANAHALYMAPEATVRTPAAPTSFTATVSDANRTVTLSWQPPTSDGGSAVTGYWTSIDPGAGPGELQVDLDLPATARTKTFTNVVPGVYTAHVLATNADGNGAEATQTITFSVPGAPRDVAWTKDWSTKTFTVTWQPPAYRGSSAITHYRVTRTGNGQPKEEMTVPATSTLSQTFPSSPAGMYSFSVEAMNTSGSGMPHVITNAEMKK
jgi:subtilisin family serine protease